MIIPFSSIHIAAVLTRQPRPDIRPHNIIKIAPRLALIHIKIKICHPVWTRPLYTRKTGPAKKINNYENERHPFRYHHPPHEHARQHRHHRSHPTGIPREIRIGESAARDERIVLSCSKDGAECGQGHFFQAITNTLAPLVHWRVCHIWEWLKHWAPTAQFGDWNTTLLADAYGGDEAEEINARTGCICCPLASKDTALDTILAMPRWQYLAPLRRLRHIYADMRKPANRLRQTAERKKNGGLATNPDRMGPLSMRARKHFFGEILKIQTEINSAATAINRPVIDILNPEEIEFIRKCWSENTWPKGWTGHEIPADQPQSQTFRDGTVQPLLFY